MARQVAAPPQGEPTIPPRKGIDLLSRQIEKAKALLAARPITAAAEQAWDSATRDYLEQAFGANTSKLRDVFPQRFMSYGATEGDWERGRAERLDQAAVVLEALLEVLDARADRDAPPAPATPAPKAKGRRIFIVHGHDKATKLEAAAFLQQLDLDVAILHELPNGGKTLIEKFEHHADVDYAVILLTADDFGRADDGTKKLTARARQNVVLEHGYFIGRLGRKYVCALHETGVELPSDLQGIVYLPLDAEWKLKLAQEIDHAGIPIDFNRLKKAAAGGGA